MKTINLPEWMADSLETEATLTLHFQPGHHPDSIIFLCLELTIFSPCCVKTACFLYYYAAFMVLSCLNSRQQCLIHMLKCPHFVILVSFSCNVAV